MGMCEFERESVLLLTFQISAAHQLSVISAAPGLRPGTDSELGKSSYVKRSLFQLTIHYIKITGRTI